MHDHLKAKMPSHKYAINAVMLGDTSSLPWTNLGLWQVGIDYPQACQNLAITLANALVLNSNDYVLDLGCGWGASLNLWQQKYNVSHIDAVELQAECFQHLSRHKALKQINKYQGSFLNLKSLDLNSNYDAIMCIDALYHHALPHFLASIEPFTHGHTRLGFHYLVFTSRWASLSFLQKKKYRYLLGLADVKLDHIYSSHQLKCVLKQFSWQHTDIQILTEPVLGGFSSYITAREKESNHIHGLDGIKIKLTAKLCHLLFKEGILDYVQVVSYKSTESS